MDIHWLADSDAGPLRKFDTSPIYVGSEYDFNPDDAFGPDYFTLHVTADDDDLRHFTWRVDFHIADPDSPPYEGLASGSTADHGRAMLAAQGGLIELYLNADDKLSKEFFPTMCCSCGLLMLAELSWCTACVGAVTAKANELLGDD